MPEEPRRTPETVGGLTKEQILDAVTERGFINVFMGSYFSDEKGSEESRERITKSINDLLKMFDIGEEWRDLITRFEIQGVEAELSGSEDSAGQVVLDAGIYGLPIEDEEWGYADASVVFEKGGLTFTVSPSGDFWPEYTYTNKTTGEKTGTGWEGFSEDLMMYLDIDSDWSCDSTVEWHLSYTCLIEQAERGSR